MARDLDPPPGADRLGSCDSGLVPVGLDQAWFVSWAVDGLGGFGSYDSGLVSIALDLIGSVSWAVDGLGGLFSCEFGLILIRWMEIRLLKILIYLVMRSRIRSRSFFSLLIGPGCACRFDLTCLFCLFFCCPKEKRCNLRILSVNFCL